MLIEERSDEYPSDEEQDDEEQDEEDPSRVAFKRSTMKSLHHNVVRTLFYYCIALYALSCYFQANLKEKEMIMKIVKKELYNVYEEESIMLAPLLEEIQEEQGESIITDIQEYFNDELPETVTITSRYIEYNGLIAFKINDFSQELYLLPETIINVCVREVAVQDIITALEKAYSENDTIAETVTVQDILAR